MIYMEALLLVLLIITAIMVISTRDLYYVVMQFVLFSVFAVLLYTVLGAPDVALLEVVIGILFTIFLLAGIHKFGRWTES